MRLSQGIGEKLLVVGIEEVPAACESGLYTYDKAFKIVRSKVYHRMIGGIEKVGLIVYR